MSAFHPLRTLKDLIAEALKSRHLFGIALMSAFQPLRTLAFGLRHRDSDNPFLALLSKREAACRSSLASPVHAPFLNEPFASPFGAPALAPWNRHTRFPLAAAQPHDFPCRLRA